MAHVSSHSDRLESPRVALHLPSLNAGGAERVMLNLSRAISELGVPVDLVLGQASGELVNDVTDGVNVVDLGASRTMFSLPALVRYLRASRPTALLSTLAHTNVLAVAAVNIARTDTRCFVREATSLSKEWELWPPSRVQLWKRLVRAAYLRSDGIIAPSAGVAADLEGILREQVNISVIANPIITPDLHELAQAPIDTDLLDTESPTFLAVGRLDQAKDYSTLLRAFGRVRQRRAAKLLILGEGKLRSALEAETRSLRLEDCVTLPGFVANPYSYMRRCSVFVLSSRQEGSPNALIQALACGCKVVATDCTSGPREILENGRLGMLVPVGKPSALADAMLAALDAGPVEMDLERELHPYTVRASARRFLELILGADSPAPVSS